MRPTNADKDVFQLTQFAHFKSPLPFGLGKEKGQ